MSKPYPKEVRERAVRLVFETRNEYKTEYQALRAIGAKLDIGVESLRNWVRQAEVDAGAKPGVTTEESAQLKALKRENAELKRANDILKAAAFFLRGRARPATHTLVAFIDEHRDRFGGVEPICRTLTEHDCSIHPSTYYAHKKNVRSARAVRDAELIALIKTVHAENYSVYGARKVWRELLRQGHQVARCTVERLMKAEGLSGAVRGKKVVTTVSDKNVERAPDLLKREFVATAPNRIWVADFTYVHTFSGTVYVAFVVDTFSRRIIGWSAATNKRTGLIMDALEMGLWQRDRAGVPIKRGELIHHSDAGSQYTSFRLSAHLASEDIAASIGTVADALDNTLMESTIGLYKTELIKRQKPWRSLTAVEITTAEWVDWYNQARLHGELHHVPPAEYEAAYYHQNQQKPLVTATT
ncbi:IS3 family transposase [Streptomyces sp. H10-C2]|uniref:IS3 family transposase n=1 Tax=unclassified Streptomyces TaxID=2593676 RepID=UPI0024B87CB1|nr:MULTISPECIES: IS3 family transposase [unclassified Streptomyces]MDJ0346422.1 IS3 family transposase [Streptomyces sp. PH10-H1]MDJ0374808.1 IS3 family transposase [Streptomyces sp. H10-C2]